MIIHNVLHGTPEWLALRAGVPTASEFDALLKADFTPRDGEMPKTYLAKKVAEKYLGRPLLDVGGFGAMEQGTILEEEAIPFYELEHDTEVQRVGFITTDDGRAGCSPDGLLRYQGFLTTSMDRAFCGLEIKCPRPNTHVSYLLAGKFPKDYVAQVHGSMFVTGATSWKFMSYCRNFPPLLQTIERDEKIQKAIGEALADFNAKLDAALAKLKEYDSGKERREESVLREVSLKSSAKGQVSLWPHSSARPDANGWLDANA